MRPSMMIGGRGLPRATYVGSAFQFITTSFGTLNINLAGAGAQVGDFCMVHTQCLGDADFPQIIVGGEGWERDNFTWATYGYRTSVLRKRLTSLGAVTLREPDTNGVMEVTTMVYRGPNAAQRRVVFQDSDTDSAHVTPGFVRSPNCVGVVGFLADRDEAPAGGTVSSPGGVVTKRRDDRQTSYFRVLGIDALPKAAYVDGAAVTWTGLATPSYEVSQLYELLIK